MELSKAGLVSSKTSCLATVIEGQMKASEGWLCLKAGCKNTGAENWVKDPLPSH